MARPRVATRGDQRCCRTCQQWLQYSRFAHRLRESPKGTVWIFDPDCRACQAKARNQAKNEDRPRAIIERRARTMAAKCGATFDFFWQNLGWKSLVPIYRALTTDPDACCQSCLHRFDNERDIQIEHFLPPRSLTDWARHSARNLRFLCTNCWILRMLCTVAVAIRAPSSLANERNNQNDPTLFARSDVLQLQFEWS